MAITFPITGVAAAYASSTSVTITLGTAPTTNDIVLTVIGGNAATPTYTIPSDWVNVAGGAAGSTACFELLLYHRVTSAEAGANTVSWTFTNIFNAARVGAYAATVLRGVATSSELSGSGFYVQPNQHDIAVIPSSAPAHNNVRVILGYSVDGTVAIVTPPGWTVLCESTVTQRVGLYLRNTFGFAGDSTDDETFPLTTGDEHNSITAAFRDASPSLVLGSQTVDVVGEADMTAVEAPLVGAASGPATLTVTPSTGIAASGKVTLAWTAPTSEVAS